MDLWMTHAADAIYFVAGFGFQLSARERFLVLGVGLLMGMVVLRLSLRGAGIAERHVLIHVGATILNAAAALAASCAVSIHLEPLIHDPQYLILARTAAPIIGSVGIGTPLAALLIRGSYGKVLTSYFFATIATGLTMMAFLSVFFSACGVWKEIDGIRERTTDMVRQINGK
jgi:hypothetical protein